MERRQAFKVRNLGDNSLQSSFILVIILKHSFFELVFHIRIIKCHFLELSLLHLRKCRVLGTRDTHCPTTVKDRSNLAKMITMSQQTPHLVVSLDLIANVNPTLPSRYKVQIIRFLAMLYYDVLWTKQYCLEPSYHEIGDILLQLRTFIDCL